MRGLARPGACPLRTDTDIALVVDARTADASHAATAREFGAYCALRHRVPLIVTGRADMTRFPWSKAAAICSPDELVGVCERLTRPVEEAVHRDAERAARAALQANGYHTDVDVTVAHIAGSTAVFLHVRGLSDGTARAEAAGLVREAVRGRRDLDGTVTVVTVPQE